jgi:predicted RNA-binding protein with TRAM domain
MSTVVLLLCGHSSLQTKFGHITGVASSKGENPSILY